MVYKANNVEVVYGLWYQYPDIACAPILYIAINYFFPYPCFNIKLLSLQNLSSANAFLGPNLVPRQLATDEVA